MKHFHNLLLIPREETCFQKNFVFWLHSPYKKNHMKTNYKPIQSINYNPSLIDLYSNLMIIMNILILNNYDSKPEIQEFIFTEAKLGKYIYVLIITLYARLKA